MLIREQPAPDCSGESVSFRGWLPLTDGDEAPTAANVVRAWAREKKAGLMRDFSALDTYGTDASYGVALTVEGTPSFAVHKELGNLGFRLDKVKGEVTYRLPLLSNWRCGSRAAAFELALEALVPRVLPLERCREIAARFVERFASGFGVNLDGLPGSLPPFSEAFLQRECAGLSPMLYLPTTVIGAGCYLGEVLLRAVPGSAWMEREDERHCNFTVGPIPFNPWQRVLELYVRGSEAALSSNLRQTLMLSSGDAWDVAWD